MIDVSAAEVLGQDLDHLDVLGEHHHLVVPDQRLIQDLLEDLELARA